MGDFQEPFSLWSIPFTLLLIMLILAAADVLFKFIPFRISNETWLWVFSTIITTICASLVSEKFSLEDKRTMISMATAAAFSILFYRDVYSFLQRTFGSSIQSMIPNPFVEMAVYTCVLTVIPGAFVGVIFGGIIGSISGRAPNKKKLTFDIPPANSNLQSYGIQNVCCSCGQITPIDSGYCPYCGSGTEQRSVFQIRYCRFCGSNLKYYGQFCSECGREIDMISKPLVFYSL